MEKTVKWLLIYLLLKSHKAGREKPKKRLQDLIYLSASIGKQQEKQTQLLEQVAENTKPERSTLQKLKTFTGDDRATDETKKPFTCLTGVYRPTTDEGCAAHDYFNG